MYFYKNLKLLWYCPKEYTPRGQFSLLAMTWLIICYFFVALCSFLGIISLRCFCFIVLTPNLEERKDTNRVNWALSHFTFIKLAPVLAYICPWRTREGINYLVSWKVAIMMHPDIQSTLTFSNNVWIVKLRFRVLTYWTRSVFCEMNALPLTWLTFTLSFGNISIYLKV